MYSVIGIQLQRLRLVFWRRELLALSLVLAGLSLSGHGYYLVSQAQQLQPEELRTQYPPEQTDAVPGIIVEVAGAVVSPGVQQVPATARVGEALDRAGGLHQEADTHFVAKYLRLAQPLSDGEKIYVPFAGEFSSEKSVVSTDAPMGVETGGISINTASEKELQSLPGIGAARSAAIVAARPYTAIDQLLSKEVLSQAVFEAIASELRL